MRLPGMMGRPIKHAAKEIAAAKERDAMNQLIREEQMGMAIEQLDLPPGFDALMKKAGTMITGGPRLSPQLSDDPLILKRQAIDNAAYEYAGHYLEERPNGGFKLWDLYAIFNEARTIELASDGLLIIVETSWGDQIELRGGVAEYALCFMAYLGMFEANSARKKCSDCADLPAGEPCDTCGGLGWTLDSANAESQPTETAEKSVNE